MFCMASEPETSDCDGDGAAAITTRSSLAWGHEGCYTSHLPPPPACRHWQRLGRCPAQEMGLCAFLHDSEDRGTSATLDKQRWGGKRHFVRNQHKNSVFRTFLMQTYGLDYLTKKDGVILDVAGGKGELSFELINLCGVKECVVIDPRPLNLSLVRGKWEKGLFEPKRTGVFSKWYPACEEGCKDRTPQSPGHMRCFFDGASFLEFANAETSEEVERTNEKLLREMIRAKSIVWTRKGLQHEDGASYNEEDESGSAAKPYPIGNTFSKRKLNDGTNVKSHEHLVQWLKERDPNARVATLDLEGKNTVVYTLPVAPVMPVMSKNAPRFLDYRRSSLPLDVALSFALSTMGDEGLGGISARDLILSGRVLVNGDVETSCHRLVSRDGDCISIASSEGGNSVEIERPIPSPRYFVCYKPRGVVCSSRRNEGIDRKDSVLISEWLADVVCAEGGDTAILCGGGKAIETVGRLDEDFHALVDLVLREGKRHAVRRIIANAGMRVCYLSRISVEGLEDVFDAKNSSRSKSEKSSGSMPGRRVRRLKKTSKSEKMSHPPGQSRDLRKMRSKSAKSSGSMPSRRVRRLKKTSKSEKMSHPPGQSRDLRKMRSKSAKSSGSMPSRRVRRLKKTSKSEKMSHPPGQSRDLRKMRSKSAKSSGSMPSRRVRRLKKTSKSEKMSHPPGQSRDLRKMRSKSAKSSGSMPSRRVRRLKKTSKSEKMSHPPGQSRDLRKMRSKSAKSSGSMPSRRVRRLKKASKSEKMSHPPGRSRDRRLEGTEKTGWTAKAEKNLFV
ncbi:hypothetical protein ACHAXT_012961 [Thalassiosira profunda]